MQILLTSDTHLGITTQGQIRKMLREAKAECPAPDFFVHAGDFSGNKRGAGAVKLTCELIRSFYPDTPFLSVLGNHDFWAGENPAMDEYCENLVKIEKAFHDYNAVWLSEKSGIWHSKDAIFMGVHGWYQSANPMTNDKNFLPKSYDLDNNINCRIRNESEHAIDRQTFELIDLDERVRVPRICISHFPLIFPSPVLSWDKDHDVWSHTIGPMLKKEFGVTHFLNGHTHQRWEGQEGRYECGSDYGKPRYQVIEI